MAIPHVPPDSQPANLRQPSSAFDGPALLEQARSHLAAGRHEEARECCRQILNRNPQDREALGLLGQCRFDLQDFERELGPVVQLSTTNLSLNLDLETSFANATAPEGADGRVHPAAAAPPSFTRPAENTRTRFPSLPQPGEPAAGLRPKVCFVAYDLVGPIRNGGVGTACTSMAEALARAGHDVTILYLGGEYCENQTIEHWIAHYRKSNIQLVPLPQVIPYRMIACWHQSKAFEAYVWLRERSYDVIHFADWRAAGYYSILAQHQGLAFPRSTLCVSTHGPTMWSKLSNGEYVTSAEDLEIDFMEAESVRLASAVVSPSHYLLRWMQDQGWQLSPETFVQQYITPATALASASETETLPQTVQELVFFGRLEVRKGLVLFCDAMDRLCQDPALGHIHVTFMGKSAEIDGVSSQEYLKRRTEKWPWKIEILTTMDQPGAMAYLKQKGRLAVIPSLTDNLPFTVLECLCAQIPFLSSNVGGIPEMVRAEDYETTCFDIQAKPMATKIRQAVQNGVRPARMAISPSENESGWVDWHVLQAQLNRAHDRFPLAKAGTADARPDNPPLVSICLSHYNRPKLLRQALDSIRDQDYPNIEVVLVDDASTSEEALAYIRELEPEFHRRQWQLIRNTEERFVGAARNQAARQARGQFLLFMDDDNCAKPHEVSTFVQVARQTGADIVTCFLDFFSGYDRPRENDTPKHRVLFLGAALSGGALHNTFGDTNALIRREVFLTLGGFHELRHVGHEDWQLYGKAVFSGYRLEVVPDALVWYRRNESEQFATRCNSLHAGHMQNIKPYLDAVPVSLRNLILFVQGQSYQLEKGDGQTANAIANSKHTIHWRSNYEAGRILAKMGHTQQAIHCLLDALQAAESSRHPIIILESLLFVGKALTSLDAGRARQALELAATLAGNLENDAAFKQAQYLLRTLESLPPADTAVVSSPGSSTRPTQAGMSASTGSDPTAEVNPLGDSNALSAASPSLSGESTFTKSGPETSAATELTIDQALDAVASHLNRQQEGEALALLDACLSAHPTWSGLLYPRAIVLGRMQRFTQAIETIGRLPEHDRSHPKVQQLLRELEEAEASLQAVS